MSEAPSWLTEENISTATKVTQNPAVQKAAKSAAKNPAVQNAVKKEIIKQASAPVADAPQWGSEESVPAGDVETGTRASERSSEFVMEEEALKSMQRWHLALRLLYMAAAILMAAAAGVELGKTDNLGIVFFCFYVLFFSAVICCFEFALSAVAKLIAVNFGFLYTLTGRTIFLLFVGFMSFQLSLFGKIAMGILFGVGAFHAFIMCKFPRFEEYLRKKHYYEGKNSPAKI